MSRRPLAFVALLLLGFAPDSAFAQPPLRLLAAAPEGAAAVGGRIQGTVKDDAGRLVGGASIVLMGATLAMVRSDGAGRYSLAVPAGDYVLRASRDGYLSTYREQVRVRTNAELEQHITLVRLAVWSSAEQAAGLTPGTGADSKDADHSHSEAAWRLRHLARSVLRDEGPATAAAEGRAAPPDAAPPPASLFEWVFDGSVRAASSFFTRTDFSGQVNFLTTGSLAPSSGWLPSEMPRGVAFLAVSAPVGSYGDWTVRGAITAGDLSSWVLLGEYDASGHRDHAFTVGMSFSAQGYRAGGVGSRPVVGGQVRNVGGLYGFDRWRVRRGFELDYGLRIDRYDYISAPRLFSPRVGARVAVPGRMHVTTLVSQRMIAPGADEFLPPNSTGLWLPPERTFSPLAFRTGLRAERVRHVEVGLERQFGGAGAVGTIGVRRYHHEVADQVATIFGLTATDPPGHYYVASPGDVDVDGWAVRVSGPIGGRVRGSLEYAVSESDWSHSWQTRVIRRITPSAVRPPTERLHDLTATIEAAIPGTSTKVAMDYRVNSSFSQPGRAARLPVVDGRFNLELQQALPYRPLRGSRLELLFAVRSLFRDLGEIGSLYDELLTIAPPVRMTGGVQVRF
jgi:hypothetical protein